MSTQKICLMLKTTVESFSMGATVAGIIVSVIAAFMTVPLIISAPIVGGVAFIFALGSAAYAIYEFRKQEKQNETQEQMKKDKLHHEEELIAINKKMRHRLKNLKKSVEKDYQKTEIHLPPEIFHPKEKQPYSANTSLIFQAVLRPQNDVEFNAVMNKQFKT